MRDGKIGAAWFRVSNLPTEAELRAALERDALYVCLTSRHDAGGICYPCGMFIADNADAALDQYEEALTEAGWSAATGEILSARRINGSQRGVFSLTDKWIHRSNGPGPYWAHN